MPFAAPLRRIIEIIERRSRLHPALSEITRQLHEARDRHHRMFGEHIAERFARPRLRIAPVLALAVLSLATALPNYFSNVYPIYGHFGFVTDEAWRVVASWRKPLKEGDVIDWRRLPFSERYDTADFPRLARVGTRVVFPVIRDGRHLEVVLVSEYHAERFGGSNRWWLYGFKKAAELLIVLLGAALLLIRRTKLSALFFLYVAALATDGPVFWSFLPAPAYVPLLIAASIVAFPLPPAALTLFALEMGGEERSAWRAMLRRAIPYVFALSAVLIGLWIVREHFAIIGPDWLPLAGTFAVVWMWALAAVALASEVLTAWRRGLRAVSAVSVALIASALCYLYIDGASLFGSGVVGYNDFWALGSLVFSLAAVYIIVRGRIIDTRLYITRAALSAVIGSLLILAFSLLNLVFAAQIVRAPYVLPIEILIAAWLGFRLSGVQDVAAATSILTNEAPDARICGDRGRERDVFALALARAERTRNTTLIATVRAHAAFGAWFAGDDDEFESHTRAIHRFIGNGSVRALGRFSTVGQVARADGPAPGELPEWTARTELVVCGDSNDSVDAKHHARLALGAAEASGDPFLEAVAAVALAEFDADARALLYERAQACCVTLGASRLLKEIRALSTCKESVRVLDAFVKKRLRAPRPARPTLEVRFAGPSVYAYGAAIDLRQRELALLLFIAQAPEGASFERIADTLWPDLDGDSARNVLRVTVHRLRRDLGDAAAIVRNSSRYRLRDGAVVDLWQVRNLLESTSGVRPLSEHERSDLREALEAFRLGRQTRPNDQEWFFEIERTIARLYHDVEQRLAQNVSRQEDGTFDEQSRGALIGSHVRTAASTGDILKR